MLSKTRHFVSLDKLLSVYYAIFSSHMTYSSQICGINTSSNYFKKIERLQNKAKRIMSFSATQAPCEPIYKKFGILKLEDQISLFSSLYAHDQTHEVLPSSSDNFFTPCTDLYDTGTIRRVGSLFTFHVNSHTHGRHSIKLSSILT